MPKLQTKAEADAHAGTANSVEIVEQCIQRCDGAVDKLGYLSGVNWRSIYRCRRYGAAKLPMLCRLAAAVGCEVRIELVEKKAAKRPSKKKAGFTGPVS